MLFSQIYGKTSISYPILFESQGIFKFDIYTGKCNESILEKKGSTICLIPARGGSKRIPKKNILPLNGIPLVSYTIRAARSSSCFDRIVVSSDDPDVGRVAKEEGVEWDERPPRMSGDEVTKVQVVREYIEREAVANFYDRVACLLPTCPFRSSEDIRKSVELFDHQGEDIPFLVAVTEYEFPIQLALEVEGYKAKMLDSSSYRNTRSQNNRVRFHPNGAIYLSMVDAFMEKGTFFSEEMLAHRMPPLRSFDIDHPYQFRIAELIVQEGLHLQGVSG